MSKELSILTHNGNSEHMKRTYHRPRPTLSALGVLPPSNPYKNPGGSHHHYMHFTNEVTGHRKVESNLPELTLLVRGTAKTETQVIQLQHPHS